MKRHLISQKSAFTITLPIEWIREHGLRPGDEIDLSEEGNYLTISTNKKSSPDTIKLDLDRGAESYYRIMIENHYLKGYDTIEINYPDKDAMHIIKEIVSNLNGMEIVDQHGNYCRISQTSIPGSEEFKTLLSRSMNIIKYTQELIVSDLLNNSFKNHEEIESLTKDLRRFMLFCTRTLHKTSIISRREESFMHLLLERLILIQHNHLYMYEKLAKSKGKKIRKDIMKLYSESCRMYDMFYEMFGRKEMTHFSRINDDWERIYFKEGQKAFTNATFEESVVIYHSMYLSKQVFLISQPSLVMQKI